MANVLLALLHDLGLDNLKEFGDSTGTFDLDGHSAHQRMSGETRCARTHRSHEGAAYDGSWSSPVSRGAASGVCGRRAPVADATDARRCRRRPHAAEAGADVNAAHGDGMTALHWAARRGDTDVAQMLIYAGANVKASTRLGGYTPLLMASQLGHAGVMRALLKAGAN